MNAGFEDRFASAAPTYPKGQEPVSVSATPYTWRDPRSIPRRPWIYGRQIMRGQVGGKFAPGGAGKTTHEIGVALALATGRDFLGQRVWNGPKRVWLWNLEDSGEELARSIQAACIHWGIGEADIDGRLFVDSALDGAILKLATQTSMDGVVVNEPLVEALVEELLARNIDYLTIDPFISSHNVEENDNGAIDTVVKKWAAVAKRANCAITLTHHVRKVGGGEVNAEHARGASSLVAACRSALVLNRMSDAEAKDFGIQGDDRRRYFRVYDDKNNRAPPASASDWFYLSSIDLGNGDPEIALPGDSMGVAEPWSPPDAFENVKVSDLLQVQRLVHERGNVRANSQATRWIGRLVAEVLSLDPAQSADRAKINSLVRTWVRNGALREVEKADNNGDERKFIEVGEWANGAGSAPSAPSNHQVRKGAEGAGTDRVPAPAPPLYRGAGVRDGAGGSQGAGKSAGAGGLTVDGNLVPRVTRPPVFLPDEDDPAADLIGGGR